jgi:hypothetical protein
VKSFCTQPQMKHCPDRCSASTLLIPGRAQYGMPEALITKHPWVDKSQLLPASMLMILIIQERWANGGSEDLAEMFGEVRLHSRSRI